MWLAQVGETKMLTDFATEYSRRTDGELLHLASARHSLVPEAAAALDSELRRRNLSESDRIEHQKSVKRQERREGRRQTNLRRRWERLGLRWQLSGREILELLAVMAVVLVAYFALPSRYHLNPDWQEAAVIVMLTVDWACLHCAVMAEHRLLDFTGSLFRHSSCRRPCLDATDSRPWPRRSQDCLLSRVCAVPRRLWGCSSIATGVSQWGRSPDNPSLKRSRS